MKNKVQDHLYYIPSQYYRDPIEYLKLIEQLNKAVIALSRNHSLFAQLIPTNYRLIEPLLSIHRYFYQFNYLNIEPIGDNFSLRSSMYYFPLQYQPINYLFDIFQYILLPIYSFIRLIVSSFDVIHTIGFYSLGIKIDAIPGKINSTTTLRLLNKGEYRGKCFELCGQGHLLMMSSTIVYWNRR